jgi:hypothetical protein
MKRTSSLSAEGGSGMGKLFLALKFLQASFGATTKNFRSEPHLRLQIRIVRLEAVASLAWQQYWQVFGSISYLKCFLMWLCLQPHS